MYGERRSIIDTFHAIIVNDPGLFLWRGVRESLGVIRVRLNYN
jgi:hypothetical protein